jgi:hypothetical protein
MPAFLALWFAWRGRRAAFWWCLGALAVLLWGIPTTVLGPARHHELLGRWVDQQGHLVGAADETRAERRERIEETGVEGQSLRALALRWMAGARYVHLRSDRHIEDRREGAEGIRVGAGLDLRFADVAWIAAALAVLAACALHTRAADDALFPLQAGVVAAAILLLSPESRNPHFQALAPLHAAMAVRWAGRGEGRRLRWWPGWIAAAGALAVMLPSAGYVGRAAATRLNAYGLVGVGAILLFVAGVAALREARPAAPSGAAP